MNKLLWGACLSAMWICVPKICTAETVHAGKVVEFELVSQVLADNLIGLRATRAIHVYLPPGYEKGTGRYPVVYFFHNMYSSPRQVFEEHRLGGFFDRAIAIEDLREVIVVAGDFTTPSHINMFGNTSVAGRWIDHIVAELVPQIDARFRTIAKPESRAATGHFFGAFAALKLGMWHPETFGVVYALHPVGTGTGLQPGMWRPNWELVHSARDFDDLRKDTYAPIFVVMAQAYLPNPKRPPFYCDFMLEREGAALVPNARNIATLYGNFLLDSQLPARADALKRLRALKLDWGRYDATPGHVYANQAFTRKLEELGVRHFAEEFSGNDWNQLWIENGRVEADLMPFLARHLEGAAPPR
jgi:hypothetical protein